MAKARSKKSTARKSAGKRKAGAPRAFRFMAGALLLVAIAGIAGVKHFQTPRGQAMLLDNGVGDYYAVVQENIDVALRVALEEFGMRRTLAVRAKITRMNGRTVRFLEWTIPCDEATDFVLVNVALTNAAKKAGGRVRSTEERGDGRTLVVHAGTLDFDTHRITIGKPSPRATTPTAVPNRARPRVAIVIDDFGYSRGGVAAEMLELDLPLTVSVLPALSQSATMAKRAKKSGHCTLLHLPLEAEEEHGYDVAPVTTAMSDAEIREMVRRYIEGLSGIDGVNNHQGSLATTDPRVMRAVLAEIRRHGLFFLDSLTSPNSVAYNTAKDMGMPAAQNRIFLDDDTEDADVVAERLHSLVALANRYGSAIGIGHPHSWTLEALLESEHYLKNAGVDLVGVCELVE